MNCKIPWVSHHAASDVKGEENTDWHKQNQQNNQKQGQNLLIVDARNKTSYKKYVKVVTY